MVFELRPVMAISLCYIAGIALGRLWLEAPFWALLLPALLLMVAGRALWKRRLTLFALFLFILAVAAGAASFLISAGPASGNVLNFSDYPLFVEGTVVEEPLRMEDHTTYHLQAELVETRRGRLPVSGKLLVKVYGEEQKTYWFGEKLRLRGVITGPRGRRNPGGFDYRFYLRTRGISGVMHLSPYQVVSQGSGSVNRLARSALTLRLRLVAGIETALPPPSAQLLAAILFGQRHLLPECVQASFIQSGVAHLLAVSGLHVGLVAALVLGLCRRFKIKGRLPLAVAVLIIFGYAYLTGMRPPALRAAVMFAMAAGALLLDRENDLPTAISLAALLTLVFNPFQLFTAGFQLSYAATLSIIYGSPPIIGLLKRLKFPAMIRPLLAVTLAAQLGVLPICAAYFQHIPCGALWFNLLLLPVMPAVVGLGLAAALLQLLSPLPAWPLFQGVGLLLKYILAVTGLSRVAGFYYPVYGPFALAGFIYYGALGLLLFHYYRRRAARAGMPLEPGPGRPIAGSRAYFTDGAAAVPAIFSGNALNRRLPPNRLIMTVALTLVLLWVGMIWPDHRPSGLAVTFIDVGQGAAALIESGRGRILIDCGGEMPHMGGDPGRIGEEVLLPFLRYRGVRSLDLVVITHPHEDHFGGLKPLLQSIPVQAIWISPQPGSSPFYEEALAEAYSRGIPITKVYAGQQCTCFGLVLEVLGPPRPLLSGTGSDENNNSLVLKVKHPRAAFLFCGDIEQAAVQDLLRRRPADLAAGVLLVPHHGGPLPALPRLLKAVRPRVAVIPVGSGNPFGHPHPSTLEALRQAGVPALRSDRHGAVIVTVSGRRTAVKTMLTEKGPPPAGKVNGIGNNTSR